MKGRKPFDWRLVVSIAVLTLVAYVVWSGVSASNRADEALATMQQHDQAAQVDRAEAAQDRATAAGNQRALLAYTATLAARQDALLSYLRVHGIHLPTRLVTVVPRPRIVVRHHGHARPRSKRIRRPSSKHHRNSAAASTPTGPGKSGSAPGHRKHHH